MTEDVPFRELFDDVQVIMAIINRRLPSKPENMCTSRRALWELSRQCCEHSPDKRPTIEYAVSLLSSITSPTEQRLPRAARGRKRKIPGSDQIQKLPKTNANPNSYGTSNGSLSIPSCIPASEFPALMTILGVPPMSQLTLRSKSKGSTETLKVQTANILIPPDTATETRKYV